MDLWGLLDGEAQMCVVDEGEYHEFHRINEISELSPTPFKQKL